MPAYNNVKVWTADSTPHIGSRPSRVRGAGRAAGRAHRPEETRERAERNVRLGVWARLIVVTILSAAMFSWPYGRSCGFGLATYLAAATMIIVGGLWVVACTWMCRMARTHALALLVSLWGVGLIALEIMPRIGYAAQPATWSCGAATRATQ